MTSVEKMVGKSVAKKEEIRANIKTRSKISCSLKQIFTEISVVYGSTHVSYGTLLRWEKKIDSVLESKNAPKAGRPKSASCDEIVSKVKEVERDARYTVCDIARIAGFSHSRVYYIIKNILTVRKISARWVPLLLTDGQKTQWVKIAKQLLKIYDEKKFANVVTCDETWGHYF